MPQLHMYIAKLNWKFNKYVSLSLLSLLLSYVFGSFNPPPHLFLKPVPPLSVRKKMRSLGYAAWTRFELTIYRRFATLYDIKRKKHKK